MYVVLRTEKEILTSEVVENTESKYHSAFLISTIKNILRKNNLKPEDLDVIGINIGPGSFTGIRACTTVARVMAQQLGIKAIGVSSLDILSELGGENPLVALDARKNKAYLWCDNEIKGAVELEQVQEIIKNGSYNVITDDRLQKLLGGTSYQQGNYPLGEILSDLEGSAKKLAHKYNCIAVLKTHRTIITDGNELFINQHGNSALAKAGSGDVLAGIIAGILAQGGGLSLFEAAKLGVYLHSRTGEIASEKLTEYSVLASELPKYLHLAIKELITD